MIINLKALGQRFESFIGLGVGYEVADKYGRKWIRGNKVIPIRYVDMDILLMCHEQAFMTIEQILRMFSPDVEGGNKVVLKRVQLMQEMEFLTTVKPKDFSSSFYLITRTGLKLLREIYCLDAAEKLRAVDVFDFH